MYRISVLMGIYNCADTLQEALDSLYNQTYQNFEIILCDDGSKDNTYEIAEENRKRFPDKIKLIKNPKNVGLNQTLNNCLKIASGEYIARMDGDDISLPDRFDVEVKFLDEHPDVAVVSTPCKYFDEKGIFRINHGQGLVKKENFIRRSPISHAPCMARTEVIKSVGGYSVDDKLLRVEDYHLWFKVFAKGYKLYQMEESKYLVRVNNASIKRRTWKNRRNEFYVKMKGYSMIQLPWYTYIYTLEPLILYLIPTPIYKFLYRNKNKKFLRFLR